MEKRLCLCLCACMYSVQRHYKVHFTASKRWARVHIERVQIGENEACTMAMAQPVWLSPTFDLFFLFILLRNWCRCEVNFSHNYDEVEKNKINFHIIIIISSAVTDSIHHVSCVFLLLLLLHVFAEHSLTSHLLLSRNKRWRTHACVCALACGNIEEIQIELPPHATT